MWGEQAAKFLGALPAIIWALLAGYLIWLLRGSLATSLARLTSLEVFGVKVAVSPAQALNAAVEMARKHKDWLVDVPEADRQRALDRAQRERTLLEGAEILWVDDRPSNNRNEARMFRGFGAMLTFACTTAEAIGALELGSEQIQPFHLILSDMSRDIPQEDPEAGLKMIPLIRKAKQFQPIILYVGRLRPDAALPPGVFGITNRPDQLLHLVLDALARVRGGK